MLTIGSLFSGIGGLELGLEWAGLGPVLWQVEADEFCRRVLARHWPHAERVCDVRDVSAFGLEPVDLICGGFPCQDVSVAGKGAGLTGDRSGLWAEFARIVDEARPGWVLVENVSHGRSRWLPGVLADLEALGYHATPYAIAARDVGAPHKRDRCFVVANANGFELWDEQQRDPARRKARGVRNKGKTVPLDVGEDRRSAWTSHWAAPPALHRVDDGLPGWVDGGAEPADFALRHHAIGNAVVPQVAEAIGRLIVRNGGGSA